jgi:predicted amino acid dehydrogenase
MAESDSIRRGHVTLGTALRDILINFLPIKQLPAYWIQRLFGYNATFIFLTHPRDEEDIFFTFPLLASLRRVIPPKWILSILSIFPCFVAAKVYSPQGLKGFFISTPLLPAILFQNRDKTLKNAQNIIRFVRKITSQKVYIGLAAWWPIVTNSGAAFSRFLETNDRVVVTNGHAATLASIVLSVEKICRIAALSIKDLRLLVIGVGKMGGGVVQHFYGKANALGLVDQNEKRLDRIAQDLRQKTAATKIEKFSVSEDNFSDAILPALANYHIAVCTTSNVGYVIKDAALLRNCIILDDARPEAFPRIVSPDNGVIVLEGGLIKVSGIKTDSDFGFGSADNIFGCLAEAFLMNLDDSRTLKPTLGEVNPDNFQTLLNVCKENKVTCGDFKSGWQIVPDEMIKNVIENKPKLTVHD